MDIYSRKSRWKIYLAIAAVVIVLISLFSTKYLTDQLAEEERKKIELLKEAFSRMRVDNVEEVQCDVTFYQKFYEGNSTIPILLVGDTGVPQFAVNFGEENETNEVFMEKKLEEFKISGQAPLKISNQGVTNYLYFDHSTILSQLTFYPIIQLLLIASFILFGYLAFSSARRAEENRVWVGMAKETAHQLGTPISGIIGWLDYLDADREEDSELQDILKELRKDVTRLELVADRFSKIGSAPALQPVNVYLELDKLREYMSVRSPRKVTFDFPHPDSERLIIHINPHLFDWVVENLMRNALDAMNGKGKISAEVYEDNQFIYIDMSDTGKGIPPNKFKTVFRPGFTTKKRGWGLGLSLAKRIIEEYHNGKIFVKKSNVGEGTTFTIQLPKGVISD